MTHHHSEPFPGLVEQWHVIASGGSWDIVSINGYVIAFDIPMGAYADHIVKLHNESLAAEGFSPEDPGRCFITPGVHEPGCTHYKPTAPVLDLPSSKSPEEEEYRDVLCDRPVGSHSTKCIGNNH